MIKDIKSFLVCLLLFSFIITNTLAYQVGGGYQISDSYQISGLSTTIITLNDGITLIHSGTQSKNDINIITDNLELSDIPFNSLFVIINQTSGTYINLTINSPINKTYTSNIPLTINIDLSISTNGTNLIVYWNIFQYGLWRLDNLTYPLYDQFTVSNNGTYTFYVWALVDEGSLVNTVMFSSSIITVSETSVSTGGETLIPLIFALILILLSLIALVAKQPIIGIIIFAFSFVICGIFLINDSNMPYNPYSTIMVIFISLVCMMINIIDRNN